MARSSQRGSEEPELASFGEARFWSPDAVPGRKRDGLALGRTHCTRMLFVDYIAAKKIIAPVLNTLLGGASKVFESTHDQIWEAIRALVKRAIKSGEIRRDLDPVDLLRALIGVSNVATGPDWQQSAKRLVDILILGSRPVK